MEVRCEEAGVGGEVCEEAAEVLAEAASQVEDGGCAGEGGVVVR